jgi:hypothetical protein
MILGSLTGLPTGFESLIQSVFLMGPLMGIDRRSKVAKRPKATLGAANDNAPFEMALVA